MAHPNGKTAMYSVLGLQGEEKAGKRGMRTVRDRSTVRKSIMNNHPGH
jgi:hypothetical protein